MRHDLHLHLAMAETMAGHPRLIAIAGASCSGKTTLARFLAASLPGDNAVLPMDAYYHDCSSMPAALRAGVNFDAPEALDLDLLEKHLRALSRGVAVQRPVYRYATHRRSSRTEWIGPGAYVIVEGLFALYWSRLRRLYHASVFVEAGAELCLERRIARDVTERGRTRESVIRQYRTQVEPMFRQYLLPTRAYADLIVDGAAPVAVSGRRILSLAGGQDAPPRGTAGGCRI